MGEAGPTDAFTLAARSVPLSVTAGGRGSLWPEVHSPLAAATASLVGQAAKLSAAVGSLQESVPAGN